MEDRKVPLRDPIKPADASLVQAHEMSSVLHSLIKERGP